MSCSSNSGQLATLTNSSCLSKLNITCSDDLKESSNEKQILFEKVTASKELYRKARSSAFRFKRQQMREILAAKNMISDSTAAKLAKNKNRQDAARKRVRDQNGKFQGGLTYRRPRIIFAIEKVVSRSTTAPSTLPFAV